MRKNNYLILIIVLFVTTISFTLVIITPATQAEIIYPQAVANYEDFTRWYLKKYNLKTLPYRAAALFDASTGYPLYFHQENTVMPTASLIKMITAGTLLKYEPNWYTPLNFTLNDNENLLRPYVGPKDSFSLLKLENGDQITLEQAFASMLIGSANNAAVSIGRGVGLERTEFIEAMRTTAADWGLTRTKIDEPSGLSLANTSSAADMAHAACALYYHNFISSFYGSSPSVSFTTKGGVRKTVLHTVYDVRNNPNRYFGAKTGYLHETKYHLAAGIITPSGRRLCAAVLTSPTRAESEHAMNALRLWADEMYKWQ